MKLSVRPLRKAEDVKCPGCAEDTTWGWWPGFYKSQLSTVNRPTSYSVRPEKKLAPVRLGSISSRVITPYLPPPPPKKKRTNSSEGSVWSWETDFCTKRRSLPPGYPFSPITPNRTCYQLIRQFHVNVRVWAWQGGWWVVGTRLRFS